MCEGEGQENSLTELSSKLTSTSRELTSWRDAAQSAGSRAAGNAAHISPDISIPTSFLQNTWRGVGAQPPALHGDVYLLLPHTLFPVQ